MIKGSQPRDFYVVLNVKCPVKLYLYYIALRN